MTISVDKKTLCAALERVCKVAQSKSTMPILSHVAISAEDSRLFYRATNLSMSLSGDIDCTGKPAAFTANARELLAAAGSVIGDVVKIAESGGRVTVSGSGKRSFKIGSLPASEFPVTDAITPDWVTVPAASVREIIDRVLFAVAPDSDERPHLRSVRLRLRDGELSAAGANGHMAAIAKCSCVSSSTFEALVPRGTIPSILSLSGDSLEMGRSENALSFRSGRETIQAQTIASNFVPIDEMFSSTVSRQRGEVNAAQMVDSVTAIRRVNSAKDIVMGFGDGELKLECPGEGYSVDSVELNGKMRGELGIAADYLLGALKSCETAELGIGGELDPLVVSAAGMIAMIMPVRLAAIRGTAK